MQAGLRSFCVYTTEIPKVMRSRIGLLMKHGSSSELLRSHGSALEVLRNMLLHCEMIRMNQGDVGQWCSIMINNDE